MYAAFCPESWALRKMSPVVVSVSLPLIVTTGGVKPGWVTKVCVRGWALFVAGRRAGFPAGPPPATLRLALRRTNS